jgi:benzylsuccinate CoA-transferase BbsF subunit
VEASLPAPGAGIGHDTLRAVNPGLIMLSSSLNGQTGPDRGWRASARWAPTSQASGTDRLARCPPAGPFTAYTDYTAPKRSRSRCWRARPPPPDGRGPGIDLSQIEAALHYITPALLKYQVDGGCRLRGNGDAEHAPTAYPCAGKTAGSRSPVRTDEWQALCQCG